jgi:hypothetical protein
MKKIILSAAILAFAGLTTVKANILPRNPVAVTIQQDTVRTPVKLEELPDAVKTTLSDATFKVWVPTSANHVKAPNTEYYEITVKKGDQTQVVKIGPDGKVIQ